MKATEELTSTAVVLLFQNLICLLLILPIALRGGLASLKTKKIGLHILRAVSGTAAWYALFVAITMMPLTNAILLTFSAPLWMPVIAWVLFREKASRSTWVGAAIGFVGVLLVLQPHHQHFNIGALIALAGARCLAIAFMSVRWLGATEPTTRILFYYFGISSVLCTPFAMIDWRPFGLRGSIYLVDVALTLLVGQALIVLALPLRISSQGWPVRLHGHRFHGADRLVSLESRINAARRVRHGPGDRRRDHRDPQEVRGPAGGRRTVAVGAQSMVRSRLRRRISQRLDVRRGKPGKTLRAAGLIGLVLATEPTGAVTRSALVAGIGIGCNRLRRLGR